MMQADGYLPGTPLKWLHESSWAQRYLLILCALFPVLAVSIPSGGSVVYTLLGLPALIFAWPQRHALTPGQRWWLLSLFALFLLAAVSLFYSADLVNGIEKLERFFRLATLGLIYLLLRRMHVEAGSLFLWGVAAAAASLGLQAFYEIHVLKHGVSVGLYHKIVFGDMAVLSVAVLLAALLTVIKRPWQYAVLLSCIAAALYASVMSFTRASWLLLPVLLVLLLVLYRKQLSRRVWFGLALALVVSVVALSITQPQRLKQGVLRGAHDVQQFMSNPGKRSSWGDRLNMWRNSLIIWGDNPFIGTGLGDFNHDSRLLVEQGISYSRNIIEYGHAHSIYFDALATLGAAGLLLLLLALVALPWRLFYCYWLAARDPLARFYALAGLLTVFCFAFFGLTEGWTARNPFVNPYVIYIAVFASALAVRQGRDKPVEKLVE